MDEKEEEKNDIDAKTVYDDHFSSCCSRSGTTDARLIRYASKFTISLLMLGFASIQLVRSHECDSLVPFYTSLITFVMGSWIKVDGTGTKHNNEK
jgi:hypothetical protein